MGHKHHKAVHHKHHTNNGHQTSQSGGGSARLASASTPDSKKLQALRCGNYKPGTKTKWGVAQSRG